MRDTNVIVFLERKYSRFSIHSVKPAFTPKAILLMGKSVDLAYVLYTRSLIYSYSVFSLGQLPITRPVFRASCHWPWVELAAVLKSAGVVHGQLVALLRPDVAYFGHVHLLHLETALSIVGPAESHNCHHEEESVTAHRKHGTRAVRRIRDHVHQSTDAREQLSSRGVLHQRATFGSPARPRATAPCTGQRAGRWRKRTERPCRHIAPSHWPRGICRSLPRESPFLSLSLSATSRYHSRFLALSPTWSSLLVHFISNRALPSILSCLLFTSPSSSWFYPGVTRLAPTWFSSCFLSRRHVALFRSFRAYVPIFSSFFRQWRITVSAACLALASTFLTRLSGRVFPFIPLVPSSAPPRIVASFPFLVLSFFSSFVTSFYRGYRYKEHKSTCALILTRLRRCIHSRECKFNEKMYRSRESN